MGRTEENFTVRYTVKKDTRILAIRVNTEWYIDNFKKTVTKHDNTFYDEDCLIGGEYSSHKLSDWLYVQTLDFESGGGSLHNIVVFTNGDWYMLVESANVHIYQR